MKKSWRVCSRSTWSGLKNEPRPLRLRVAHAPSGGSLIEGMKGDVEMAQTDSVNAIPKDTAFQLCAEIRQEYRGKWYTFAGLQCGGCIIFSKGDPAKMCVSNRPDYRGCNLVNARYDQDTSR